MNMERRPRGSEGDHPTFAGIGRRYFISISQEYAASTIAQGLALAKLCKASGHEPRSLMLALSGNRAEMDKVISAANAMHQSRVTRPIALNYTVAQSIVTVDGNNAHAAMILDPQEIDELLAEYPASMKDKETRVAYKMKFYAKITDKQRELSERGS